MSTEPHHECLRAALPWSPSCTAMIPGCGAVADDEGREPLVGDATMEVEVRGPVVAANCTAMRRRTTSRNLTHFQVWRPNCTRWNPAPWRRPGSGASWSSWFDERWWWRILDSAVCRRDGPGSGSGVRWGRRGFTPGWRRWLGDSTAALAGTDPG